MIFPDFHLWCDNPVIPVQYSDIFVTSYPTPITMSWKEAKVEPSPGLFPVSEAETKRPGPDLKDLYLAVSSVAGQSHLQNTSSSPMSAILGTDL